MREERNISQGRFAHASMGAASMEMGGVNADYRTPRRHDSATSNPRKMAYVAGGIAVLLAAIVGASSVMAPRRTGLPVVEADSRPLRVKPDKAGGMTGPSADEALLADQKPGSETLAPAPEAPAPAMLKQPALEAAHREAAAKLAAATPPAPVVATPAPVAAPVVAPAVAHPVAAGPAAKPAPSHLAAAPVVTKPAIAPVAPPAKPASGSGAVQLAALVSEQGAQAEWDRLAKKFPDLFAGHKPNISKFERDGKVFWRLRTTGFADHTAAAAFCDKAKAGGLACLAEKA